MVNYLEKDVFNCEKFLCKNVSLHCIHIGNYKILNSGPFLFKGDLLVWHFEKFECHFPFISSSMSKQIEKIRNVKWYSWFWQSLQLNQNPQRVLRISWKILMLHLTLNSQTKISVDTTCWAIYLSRDELFAYIYRKFKYMRRDFGKRFW
jgi:hypothetical protein